MRFWRLAAEQGHAGAQYNLGIMLKSKNGDGRTWDDADDDVENAAEYHEEDFAKYEAEAVRFFLLAVEQGDAGAQFQLGDMFNEGRGVAQDYAEAVRLWRLAAAQGYADAQTQLGIAFQYGLGVAQDRAEATRMFRLGFRSRRA